MEPGFRIDDEVEVIGCTEDLDWISYVHEYDDQDDNMDNYVGTVQQIIQIEEFEPGKLVYKLSGIRFFWAEEWLRGIENDSEISLSCFEEVIN